MNHRRPRRAFVTAMAVTLIALVAVALAALTTRVSTTARQAAQSHDRAQAEELILAAIAAVQKDPAVRTIELPSVLRDTGASVKLTGQNGRVRIEVTVGRTHLMQEAEVAANGVKLFAPGEE
jgi:type II secretory pathway component PulK